ncbi:hypothetical protein FACS189432_06670 [Bacteroidia bacterium]|nr:hypothetical protein FACS189426_12820 [Bacteroidia bacterium]GHT28550.1 hypothetical protein FACS189432_06670 [Bacteroidia bacterium]
MGKKKTIIVQGTEVTLYSQREDKYISLTDMAKFKNSEIPAVVISHWMSTVFSVNFMGIWERMNNPNFNLTGFREVKMMMTETGFALSPKQWIEKTNATGIISKSGRYGGGTFAHRNIAFEFASWLSPEFKYYLISEFDRLKQDEQQRLSLEWNLQRTLSKINYRIHTDAIKEQIIPAVITKEQASFIYANEADLLNVALFGKTAAQWRSENPDNKGNIRDLATLEQLVVLSNMESINALLIRQGLPQSERLLQLNGTAITQMRSLLDNQNLMKRLK